MGSRACLFPSARRTPTTMCDASMPCVTFDVPSPLPKRAPFSHTTVCCVDALCDLCCVFASSLARATLSPYFVIRLSFWVSLGLTSDVPYHILPPARSLPALRSVRRHSPDVLVLPPLVVCKVGVRPVTSVERQRDRQPKRGVKTEPISTLLTG